MNPFRILLFVFLLMIPGISEAQQIIRAIRDGDVEQVEQMLKENPALKDSVDGQSNTPLHMAAYFNQEELTEQLIDWGIQADARNRFERPPLVFAIAGDALEVAEQLLQAGADVMLKDDLSRTPLHWAAYQGSGEMAEFLIGQGAAIHELDEEQKTPLHLAAQRGNTDVARVLINAGALVNTIDDHSRTPLFNASWEGHMDMVRLLIDRGAVVDARYLGAASPLTTAAVADHDEICKYLVSKGANVNLVCNMQVTPLYPAVYNNNLEMLNFYLDHQAKVNYQDIAGRTPLYIAVRDGYYDMARRLIEYGADYRFMDKSSGRNLLHIAASNGRREMAKMLISMGLEVNAKDGEGLTPLDYAAKHRHKSLYEELKKRGAIHGAYGSWQNHVASRDVQAEKEALLIKLRNKTWGVRTQSSFITFRYDEHGMLPEEPSLANGCMTPGELQDLDLYHFDSQLRRNNPLYEREEEYENIQFVANPYYRVTYEQGRPFEVSQMAFPEDLQPLVIGNLTVTTLPGFQPYRKSYLIQTDGLNILWLYQHSDRYLPWKRNTEAIDYLKEKDLAIDMMLIGSPSSDMGPEWISIMEEAYEMSKELDIRASFPMPDSKMGELFREERLRKGDGEDVYFAKNPGDMFRYKNRKVQKE
jgi:ankyrin repeat protein